MANTNKWREGYSSAQRSILRDNHAEYIRRLNFLGILELDKSSSILDFGCGTGEMLELLESHGYSNLNGVDIDEELLASSSSSANVKHFDGNKLPFEDSQFDAVIAIAVLHHLDGPEDIHSKLSEIFRVIKPGGLFFCMEPSNTIVRRVLTPILLSPLSNLTRFSKQKRLMVEEEEKILNEWLSFESKVVDRFLIPAGFSIELHKRDLLRVYYRASKPQPS